MPSHTSPQFSPTGHIRDPQHCSRVCEWILDLGYQKAASSKFSRFSLPKISAHQMNSPQPLLCPNIPSQGEQSPSSRSSGKEESPWDQNVTDSEDMINYLNRQNYIPLVTFSSTSTLPLPPFPPASPQQFFPLWTCASKGSVPFTLLSAKCFLFSTTCPRPSHQLLIKWSMNMQINPRTHFIKLNKKKKKEACHVQQQNRWWGGLLWESGDRCCLVEEEGVGWEGICTIHD